jgi:hypothetical protein
MYLVENDVHDQTSAESEGVPRPLALPVDVTAS